MSGCQQHTLSVQSTLLAPCFRAACASANQERDVFKLAAAGWRSLSRRAGCSLPAAPHRGDRGDRSDQGNRGGPGHPGERASHLSPSVAMKTALH